MTKELRRGPRLECTGIASVQVTTEDPVWPAKILDVSVEGCLLELEVPQKLHPDTMVEITFTVNHLPFRVRGQVRAVRPDMKLGFKFPALSQRGRTQLEDLVEEIAKDKLKLVPKRKPLP